MGKTWKRLDKEQLKKLYEEEGRGVTELAAYFGCSPLTIRRHLHRHGIRVRSQSEEMSGRKLAPEHRDKVIKTLRQGALWDNPNWKGGRSVSKGRKKDGQYAVLLIDGRYVPEHRYVMEQSMGRKLHRDEHVHHIDGNKLNNDPHNLQVLTASEHTKLHMTEAHKEHLSDKMRDYWANNKTR